MIKLLDLLKETQILVPRRSSEERQKNYLIATQKKIQQYIKDGSKGDLNLSNTSIQSLPNGLKVGGDLWLTNTPIQSLPDGLEVGRSLDLDNCKNLESLPNDLKVEGSLWLTNTPIQSLPDGLEVGVNLDLSNTPLSKKYTEEEIKAMAPGVKGNIYL
jgi:hypothetical protein